MKKQVLLFSVVVALVVQSCQKQEEKVSLSNLKFTPPSEEKEILERIGTFKKDHEKFKEGKLNRVEEEYSVEESVWIIEATANYDFADMSEPLDSFFVDSLVISLPISSYTSNGEPVVNYSDMVVTYNNLYETADSVIGNQRTSIFGLLMVDVESQKEREAYIDLVIKIVRGTRITPIGELLSEEFQPTDCYYGFGTIPYTPFANNAAEKIERKLKTRYQIGAVANAIYTNISPMSDWITPSVSYYVPVNCPNTPGILKYWGTSDIDGLWHSGLLGATLCYTELTHYKNMIRDYLDWRISVSFPINDAISYLDVASIDLGYTPTLLNVCYPTGRYRHGFRYKTAKIVHFISAPN
ncbi:MAG: hypothetical protein ACOZCO_18000 [Bacteroidota bacterium]